MTAILTGAGFADVAFERTDARVRVGATVDDAVAYQLALGPASSIIREAGDEGRAKRAAIAADLHAAIERYARPDGIWMGTSSSAVTARRPG